MSFSLKKIKLSRSPWFSLVLTVLLFTAIAATQYAALTSRDTRSQASSPVPTDLYVYTTSCYQGSPRVTFFWDWNPPYADGSYIDIDVNSSFADDGLWWNLYLPVPQEWFIWDRDNPIGGATPQDSYTYWWRIYAYLNSDPNGGSLAYPAAPPITTPNCNPPTVDIKANNSNGPITISYNTSATLSWSSSNATGCTASNGWTGSKATSGSQSTSNLTSAKTYTLACSGSGGGG